MPYQRCDVDCIPVAIEFQPEHYDVGQKESCLHYENYNLGYKKTDKDCVKVLGDDIPDIYSGWNGDYIKVNRDGTSKVKHRSQKLVEQTIYTPTNTLCVGISFLCYNHPPSWISDTEDLLNLDYITPGTYEDDIYLASESGADYFLEVQSVRTRILLEDDTRINPLHLVSN